MPLDGLLVAISGFGVVAVQKHKGREPPASSRRECASGRALIGVAMEPCPWAFSRARTDRLSLVWTIVRNRSPAASRKPLRLVAR